jgi:hypothetical protein
MSNTQNDTIAIRTANAADEGALRRLATLDSADTLSLPALLAEVDGEPRAALSIADGKSVADPFAPTADLVTLLRMRASLLIGHAAGRTSRRLSIPIREHSHDALASSR